MDCTNVFLEGLGEWFLIAHSHRGSPYDNSPPTASDPDDQRRYASRPDPVCLHVGCKVSGVLWDPAILLSAFANDLSGLTLLPPGTKIAQKQGNPVRMSRSNAILHRLFLQVLQSHC